MSRWTRMFSSWVPVSRQELADEDATNRATEQAAALLHGHLVEAGAVASSPLSFTASDHPADADDDLVLLAEVQGLVLRHPNPFPRLRLWGRR